MTPTTDLDAIRARDASVGDIDRAYVTDSETDRRVLLAYIDAHPLDVAQRHLADLEAVVRQERARLMLDRAAVLALLDPS